MTISNSAHYDFNEQVDAMSNSEEQVDAISNYKELVDAANNPKSDPSSDPKVATHTTNRNFAQKLLKNRMSQRPSQAQSVQLTSSSQRMCRESEGL